MAIFQEYYKIDVIPKTVTAYGGGIARTGSICGAVNVAIMGLSHTYRRTNPRIPFIKTQRPILQFLNQIVNQYGSIHCSRLTECQLTSLEGIRKFREENIKKPMHPTHTKSNGNIPTNGRKQQTNLTVYMASK
jgi:hypothetical protein